MVNFFLSPWAEETLVFFAQVRETRLWIEILSYKEDPFLCMNYLKSI